MQSKMTCIVDVEWRVDSLIDSNVVNHPFGIWSLDQHCTMCREKQKHTEEVLPYGNMFTAICRAPRILVINACPPTADGSVDNEMMVIEIGRKIATLGRPKSDGRGPGRWVGTTLLNVLRD